MIYFMKVCTIVKPYFKSTAYVYIIFIYISSFTCTHQTLPPLKEKKTGHQQCTYRLQGVGLASLAYSLRVHAFICVSTAWNVIAGPTL